MRDRDGYPAGVPCWVDIAVDDPEGAAAFYAGLFGWDVEDGMPADVPGHYFTATIGGRLVAGIGSRPEGMPAGTGWTTYVWVDDADAAVARAVELGGSVVMPATDVFDAGRSAVLADPEGAVFAVWQAGRHRGAQAVNEPGTWNFSGLHARDPEAALAFYGGLFGWEANPPDPEMGGTMLLRRPGYGEHLETLQPGIIQGAADMGAPEGFADAVAWITPVADGDAPHWDVTFAVDDADAAAARAESLGGTVLVPPTDMPWVRTTVLRDPQGTVVTASRFVPPDAA
ncbi:VOC family protein [Miltoncostaea oceani]|uniref:VOC family protein n=1 Tax=Miltoncostaea oceani TaxID=2843216 RepID=UPI001C3C928F|nr:VOC family protein [Miltoncostaea oceani]